MKRSEMISKIAKWLDRSQSTVLMNGNEGKAKSFLNQLEIWGMLPPYNPPNLDHGSITDCEWEPEHYLTEEEANVIFGTKHNK